ncbi:MAG: 2-C-methyl-D-erythritol 2,4-cyclodiphosphate synthase [Bacteroidales bacterium]|nr:2-C-methyl-D-erythritol 2,4-cyclodiphosphate synthase [Bacteroidales bacterium]
MNFKVGFGYDVHRLEKGCHLTVGGLTIPFEKGSVGHSDADVLIHAIMDALLGAAGLRDIGYHFPDTDNKYKGADSKELLRQTLVLLKQKGFVVGNIDATVSLQKPRIADYIPEMRQILSEIIQIPVEDISVKATTTEKLGFVGEGKGIAAQAVVLIYKSRRTGFLKFFN